MRMRILSVFALCLGVSVVCAQPLQVLSEKVLSKTGSTRGTAYGSANKVVTVGGKTHVAWLDTKSATMISTLDHATGEWSEPVHVGSGLDNHGGPAMCADSKGYIHIVFGPHHGPLQYSVSAAPNDTSAWVKQPQFGDHATYPSLICGPDDTLYCAYRGKTAPFKLLFQRKPAGAEWTEPKVLVDADVPDGYTQFGNCLCFGKGATIHLAFHVYDNHPPSGKRAGHLQSADGGDTWALADGTPVDLPYTPRDPGWLISGPENDLRCWTMDCDPDGVPYLCVSRGKPRPHRTELWRFVGGAWEMIDLAPVLNEHVKGLFTSQATLSFDASGRLHVLVAACPNGGWAASGNKIFLLTSKDGAKTFSVVPVSDDVTPVPNWLPSIERNTGHNPVVLPHLLYTHGVAGKGCTPLERSEIRLVTLCPAD